MSEDSPVSALSLYDSGMDLEGLKPDTEHARVNTYYFNEPSNGTRNVGPHVSGQGKASLSGGNEVVMSTTLPTNRHEDASTVGGKSKMMSLTAPCKCRTRGEEKERESRPPLISLLTTPAPPLYQKMVPIYRSLLSICRQLKSK
jgi:hypothetical protein